MTDIPRETQVMAAVVTLVDSLLEDFDVVELLTELTTQCARLLDLASSGLLLADQRRQLHLMAATSERTLELELFQLQSDEGPCLDCYNSGQAVSVADLRVERRWPRFVSAATAAGFASVHAVPMRAAGTVLGTLGLFGNRVGELNDADKLVAQTLAHIACVAILQEQAPTPEAVVPRLRAALVGRTLVEQAKGYLHESLDVSMNEAFALLREYGSTHGEHLTGVCRRLIREPSAREPILAAIRGKV